MPTDRLLAVLPRRSPARPARRASRSRSRAASRTATAACASAGGRRRAPLRARRRRCSASTARRSELATEARRGARHRAGGRGVLPRRCTCLVTRFVEGGEPPRDQLREPEHARRGSRDALRVVPRGRRPAGRPSTSWRSRGARPPRRGEHDARRSRGAIEPRRAGSSAALPAPSTRRCPCHNDLLAANFIGTGDGLRIVDWEYAGMGDRYFDLGEPLGQQRALRGRRPRLLEAYFGAADDAGASRRCG